MAEPCREIVANPARAYGYTARGNLVAVVSNSIARPGLGRRGALASIPGVEGKGKLVERFPGSAVFNLEPDREDADEVLRLWEAPQPPGRRHRPGGHPGAGVLQLRGGAEAAARDTRNPRRPAPQ